MRRCARVGKILAALDRKRAPRELDKTLALAKDGRIDEVVERLVRWQGSDDDKKGWEAVYRIAAKATETADHDSGAHSLLDFKRFPLRSSHHDVLTMQPTEVAFPSLTVAPNKNYTSRGQE